MIHGGGFVSVSLGDRICLSASGGYDLGGRPRSMEYALAMAWEGRQKPERLPAFPQHLPGTEGIRVRCNLDGRAVRSIVTLCSSGNQTVLGWGDAFHRKCL